LNRPTGKEISTVQPNCLDVAAHGATGIESFAGSSGDNVRKQVAFDLCDFVLELKFALLQPLQLKLVEGNLFGNPRDNVVEVAVLAPQLLQPPFQGILIDRIVHRRFLKLVAAANSS